MKKESTDFTRLCKNVLFFLGCLMSYTNYAQVGTVLWQENFNTLNASTWNVNIGDGTGTAAGPGWGNQELEYYNTPNVYIADVPGEAGNKALVLEAKRETAGTRAFTSGKIESYGKLSVKYGLVEIRARIPNLQTGLWPALWMLGTANAGWPSKGEIDIAEMGHNLAERTRQGFPNSNVNNYVGSNLIFYDAAAVSSGNPSGAASIAYDVTYDAPYVPTTALTDRFLTYRMYWSSTSIRFTIVDGANEIDLYAAPFIFSASSDEFKSPFYFLMNLAVGGNFTDALTNSQVTAPLPAKMYVDYIKVSQWNGEGTVTVGGATAETGTFGVFTDNTPTTNKLAVGTNADTYAWNNFVAGTTTAYEGSNVIAWQTATANTWFGGGIAARQPVNLSNFTTGNLKFRIKIPANVNFKIGITDNYTNEKYISFPANTTQYGLVRDGNWGQVTIPISALTGTIALQNMNYLFTIVSDGALPTSTFQFAIDDIYYEGGGGTTTVAVTSVAMSPTTANVAIGSTTQLTGTISPSNATNQAKTWTSSNTAVATVSTTGLVTGVAAGTATITVTTSDGNKTATCAVTVTPVTATLPSPWLTSDVGAVGATGSASYAGTTFTVAGAGADIWGTADEFRYVYRTLSGDGEIVAKVNSLTNTNPWAKAGVMFRETLATGSKNATVVVTPSNGVSFQLRTATNGSSSNNAVSGQTAPKWLKMKRVGNVFTASYSADGITWTQVGSSTTISMATSVYVGLCVTSHVDATTTTASISNVSVTTSTPTCNATGATGDYTVNVSTSASNPTLTFVPSRTNVGATTCILYYGTSATATLPGYNVTPNTPFTIAATNGQRIYFYYTYSVPEGGQKNTAANKHNFTVGSCTTLVTARQSNENETMVKGELFIYPNPGTSEIYIQNGDTKDNYAVMTINGSTILTGIGNKIDVSALANGLYFITVNDAVLKFVKQ